MDDKSQTVLHQAFLVTGRGQLPPVSNTPWYATPITEISHLYPQANVPNNATVPSNSVPNACIPNQSIPDASVPSATIVTNASIPNASVPGTSVIPNASIIPNITPPRQRVAAPPSPPFMDQFSDYFQSPEARKYHGYLRPTSDEERTKPVIEIVTNRIQRFYHAVHSVHGWREVLEDDDSENKYSQSDIHTLKHHCFFLYETLTIFVSKKITKEPINLKQSCMLAVEKVKREREAVVKIIEDHDDYTHANYPSTKSLLKWLRDFRQNRESFPNIPRRCSASEKYPPFLDSNPDMRAKIVEFSRLNIKHLSGELLFQYIHNELLPALLETRREETGVQEMTLDDVFKENRLRKLSLPTVYNWMQALHFKYSPRKKTYYVDGHENPETVEY